MLDLRAHARAEAGVEVRERLVEQEDEGLLDERPTERDALLLAARQLARLALRRWLMSRFSATAFTRESISALGRCWSLSPKAMLSYAVMCG